MRKRTIALIIGAAMIATVAIGTSVSQAAPWYGWGWGSYWYDRDYSSSSGNSSSSDKDTPKFSYARSSFKVSPEAQLWKRSTWAIAGEDSYTLTLKARDTNGDLMKDLDIDDIEFFASGRDVDVSGVTNNGDGTYSAEVTADAYSRYSTAWVQYKGRTVDWPIPVPFDD